MLKMLSFDSISGHVLSTDNNLYLKKGLDGTDSKLICENVIDIAYNDKYLLYLTMDNQIYANYGKKIN